MLKSIKKGLCLICICGTLTIGGTSCQSYIEQHDGNCDTWIQEQVKKGYLTPEQAEVLKQQQKVQNTNEK